MSNNDTYKVKMTQEDFLRAAKNYFISRDKEIYSYRKEMIKQLITPKEKRFLFWTFISKPKFYTEDEAVYYLNTTYHDLLNISLWEYAAWKGSFWDNEIKGIVEIINNKGITGDIELYGEMSFIATWL